MPKYRIIAVVVSFEPDIEMLKALVVALSKQVSEIVVVDNGSNLSPTAISNSGELFHAINLDENRGIAFAQNRGIEEARKLGASHVLLFDQDSLPPSDFVATLLHVAEEIQDLNKPFAAIGPSFRDQRLGKCARFIRTKGWHKRLQTRHDGDVVEVDHLIASGSLIPIAALDIAGPMHEALFIDYVDTEWSLRAEHIFGLKTYGTFRTTLSHELGANPVKIGNVRYAIHSPLRHYYLFRNSIWLWRQGWLPLSWKARRTPRLILRLGFCLLFGRPFLENCRMIGAAILHGSIGKMGRYDS